MDREILERHLAQTEVRIAHGKSLMTQQLKTMLRSDTPAKIMLTQEDASAFSRTVSPCILLTGFGFGVN